MLRDTLDDPHSTTSYLSYLGSGCKHNRGGDASADATAGNGGSTGKGGAATNASTTTGGDSGDVGNGGDPHATAHAWNHARSGMAALSGAQTQPLQTTWHQPSAVAAPRRRQSAPPLLRVS
jgi:hypothetical protein